MNKQDSATGDLTRRIIFTGFFLLALCFQTAFAQFPAPGRPDWSFGRRGIVSTFGMGTLSYSLRDVIFQPDGKIVAIGWEWNNNGSGTPYKFLLIRYNTNGNLDQGFGNGGVAAIAFDQYARAVSGVVQPDGKIVVAGESRGDFLVARYLSDGTLDASFGTGGFVHTDTARFEEMAYEGAGKIFLLPDEKIVVAGIRVSYDAHYASPRYLETSLLVVRYNSDGTIDTSYGNHGLSVTDLALQEYFISSAMMAPDASVILTTFGGGYKDPHDPMSGSLTERLTIKIGPNGAPDDRFAQNGILANPEYSDYRLMKILKDGQMLFSNGNTLFFISPEGEVGNVIFAVGDVVINGHLFSPGNFLMQPDGKIVAVGYVADVLPGYGRGFARYSLGGDLDTSFGTNGLTIASLDNFHHEHFTVLQPDGKILNAGHTQSTPWGIVMARYHGEVVSTVQEFRGR